VKNNETANLLIGWYRVNKRDLPWRHTKNPYIIWISEIILQQTRVVQGMPYFYRFVESFPDVFALAQVDEREVLKCWEGLGYYSRARNMHFTAKLIVEKYNGVFPDNFNDLLKLKGIGNYTAAAIASFAFGEKVAVLDGNVIRVLARLYDFGGDVMEEKAKKVLLSIANELIPEKNPGEFNQAIMEFGALHCTPINPKCDQCVLNHLCEGFKNKTKNELPVKLKKVKIKTRYFNYLVMLDSEGNYYLNRRNRGDIWEGLHDFPLVESKHELNEVSEVLTVFNHGVTMITVKGPFKHILTHQIIFAKFWVIDIEKINIYKLIDSQDIIKCNMVEMMALPKPILIKNFLDKYLNL
jgi:A/G-specific adenine glycosylase